MQEPGLDVTGWGRKLADDTQADDANKRTTRKKADDVKQADDVNKRTTFEPPVLREIENFCVR